MSKFKVGDKVRLTGNRSCSIWKVGHVGFVCEVGLNDCRVSDKDGKEQKGANWSHVDELELVEEAKMGKFKVGDKINITYSSAWDGSVIISYDPSYSRAPYRFEHPVMGIGAEKESSMTLVEEKPTVDIYNSQKKTWGEMTPEEKGALLLAHHEGNRIELFLIGSKIWKTTYAPHWCPMGIYRVNPLPAVETVEMYSVGGDCFTDYRQANDKYKITYQTVNGEPDWPTLKGETL